MKDAVHTSETSVYSSETIQHYIPEYFQLHTRRRENLKSHSESFVVNDPGDCCFCVTLLEATSSENGNPTTEYLVCSLVSKEGVCNSSATCISHTISNVTTQPSIHLRLVQEIRVDWMHIQRQESWSALGVWCWPANMLGLPAVSVKYHRRFRDHLYP
jgi:hypothetical protein